MTIELTAQMLADDLLTAIKTQAPGQYDAITGEALRLFRERVATGDETIKASSEK